MRWGAILTVGLFCTALLAGVLSPVTADEEVARFLLAQGKKALSVRKFDEAITKLQRAREEDPKLYEASYVLAQVYEKAKKPAEALGAYRAFRDACKGATLDKKTARLLKKAEKRIAILGKGELELEKLQQAFGDSIMGFALRTKKSDPDIAAEALRRVLAAQPDNKAAADLLAELTGEGGSSEGAPGSKYPSPIPGINTWKDLLKGRSIPAGKSIAYKRKVMHVDSEGGTIYWTDPYIHAPDTFVYEMELRFQKVHAHGYLLGLAFARDVDGGSGNEFVMGFAQRSQLTLVHASGRKNNDLAQTAIKASPLGTWMHLQVAVQGRKVRVFLDGKRLLNTSVPGRDDLAGPIGIFHQRCHAEVRALRLGTKE